MIRRVRSILLLQRTLMSESGYIQLLQNGLGAAYQKHNICLGYDGNTRYSVMLSINHFLSVVYEACIVKYK